MMESSKREETVCLLRSELAVAVLRGTDEDAVYETALTILEGGLRAIEITLTVPHATTVIQRLGKDTDAIIGAGSARNAGDVDRCLDAGAQFVVSPICHKEMIERCIERDGVIIPGAMTPTEVAWAWDLGADLIKIFPAARLGPKYLSDLHGPLPEIPLVPTGGITDANALEYLESGAALICLGSWLTQGDPDAIRQKAQSITRLVNEYKERRSVHQH